MWREVLTRGDAQRYVELMGAASVDRCRELPVEEVRSQMLRPGYHYWLYDDGRGGRIGFAYRYVPGCGYRCQVMQYEQVGLGYEAATAIFRKKLRAELDREGIGPFETAGLIKTQPEKIAAIRREFTEIVEEADDGQRIGLVLDRTREAG